MNREAIYQALFDKVKNITGLKTVSRKLKHWNDVPPSEQPALFQIQINESPTQVKGMPAQWDFSASLYLYVNSQDGNPSTLLNQYLDKIETALKPNYNGFQELDGLVSHCWIGGTIETDEGVLGDQAVAIVPISIKIANQNFG